MTVAAFLCAAGESRADLYTWTTTTNATTWATSTAWSPGGPPTSSDDALFTGIGTLYLGTSAIGINNLTFNEPTSFVQGSPYTVFGRGGTTSTFSIGGTLTENGGAVSFKDSTSALTVNAANVTVTSGNLQFGLYNTNTGLTGLNVSGTTTISSGASVDIFTTGATGASLGTAIVNGTLDLDGGNSGTINYSRTVNVSSLSGAGMVAGTNHSAASTGTVTGMLNVTGGASPTTFSGTIQDNANAFSSSKFNASVKISGGTQILTGSNTYSGGTTVAGGTLLINNTSGSGTGTGAVGVTSGTLGGAGTISGAVTVSSGGILLAGDGASTGTALSLGGGLAMATGSALEFVLGPGNAHSTLSLSSSFTNTLASGLSVTFLGTVAAGTYDNLITGVGADPGTEGTWTIANAGYTATFTYDGANIDATIAAVPEAPVWALMALACGVAGTAQLLHRRQTIVA